MTLGLRHSLAVSMTAHVIMLILMVGMAKWFGPRLPPIMEITLVSTPAASSGKAGAAVMQAAPGGQQGTAKTKPVKAATRGQVMVATPEFVPVGKKPRRSSESLMGAEAGAGGGTLGATQGTGPAGGAGRRVRYQEPLEYPDWAKEKGIVAKVVLRFKVLPNGSVDSQIIMRRTSGWRQMDELAMKAMRNYLFEPLPPDAPQIPQWGEIALKFVVE